MKILLLLTSFALNSWAADRVLIIDTGLDIKDNRFKHLCPDGHVDFTGTGLIDRHGHGTHIAGIIDKAIDDKHCITIVKFYDTTGHRTRDVQSVIKAVQYASILGPKAVNMSMSGGNFEREEIGAIAQTPNTTFVVSAGNNGMELTKKTGIYPAQYGLPNIIVVGALEGDKKAKYSNWGKCVTRWENGRIVSYLPENKEGELHGTSQATAIVTAKILNGK